MKIEFLNDTGRPVSIHPATHHHCVVEDRDIKHAELRIFETKQGGTPFIKLWDYEKYGLQILVSVGEDNA